MTTSVELLLAGCYTRKQASNSSEALTACVHYSCWLFPLVERWLSLPGPLPDDGIPADSNKHPGPVGMTLSMLYDSYWCLNNFRGGRENYAQCASCVCATFMNIISALVCRSSINPSSARADIKEAKVARKTRIISRARAELGFIIYNLFWHDAQIALSTARVYMGVFLCALTAGTQAYLHSPRETLPRTLIVVCCGFPPSGYALASTTEHAAQQGVLDVWGPTSFIGPHTIISFFFVF
jgi:hypothetical protein